MGGLLVRYAYTENSRCSELILPMLSPVDRARAVFEQVVYAHYIKHTVRNITACLEDYFSEVQEMVNSLPKVAQSNYNLSEVYGTAIDAIHNFPHGNYATYHNLLSMPTESKLWEPTFPAEAYLPYFHQLGCGHPVSEEYGEVLPNAVLLVPTLEKYHRPVSDVLSAPETGIRIQFRRISFGDYAFTGQIPIFRYNSHNHEELLCNLLTNMNMTDWDIDKLIGLFSMFTVEPGKYHMKAPSLYVRGISDVCYDIVMNPAKRKPKSCKMDTRVSGVGIFLNMLRKLYEQHRIANPADMKVFAVFLSKCDGLFNRQLIDYFYKPASEITAMEANAFKQSEFSQYMEYKLSAGMEAIASEDGDIDTSNDEPIEEDMDMDDSGDLDSSLGEDQDQGGLGSTDLPLGDSADTPLKRDPLRQLIELAKPTEGLSDYLYRRLVLQRMLTVISNPPRSLTTAELTIMKRWVTYWINLLSVASIKDFLSRLSFQLMDIKNVKGDELLK